MNNMDLVNMHKHIKTDINVSDAFIHKFAQKYLEQRSQALFDYNSIDKHIYENLGFETNILQDIIARNAIHVDKSRKMGLTPNILTDIYRSDLGELLMTYYFEEKLPEEERFVIPLKNITYRERADLPGRGLDAIGYKQTSNEKIDILLGEAKVSADKNSPPAVVDNNQDSLYKTLLKYRNDTTTVIQRLSDYARRLNNHDAAIMGIAIISLTYGLADKFAITYGCTLIRDHLCVNEISDFGKLKSNAAKFEPGNVHFSILSFCNKSIEETVNLFYQKIQKLIAE